jgi:hypothetical protein
MKHTPKANPKLAGYELTAVSYLIPKQKLLRNRLLPIGRFEQLNQVASLKEVELQQPEYLCQRQPQLRPEFQICQEDIDTEGDPELRKDSIGCCAEKSFDLEILLDPFEEQFDFPSFLVHLSDGGGVEIKGIGEKMIFLARFLIDAANQAQGCRGVLEQNSLILGDVGGFPTPSFLEKFENGVLFQPRHEKDLVVSKLLIPGIIGESPVKDHTGPRWQL